MNVDNESATYQTNADHARRSDNSLEIQSLQTTVVVAEAKSLSKTFGENSELQALVPSDPSKIDNALPTETHGKPSGGGFEECRNNLRTEEKIIQPQPSCRRKRRRSPANHALPIPERLVSKIHQRSSPSANANYQSRRLHHYGQFKSSSCVGIPFSVRHGIGNAFHGTTNSVLASTPHHDNMSVAHSDSAADVRTSPTATSEWGLIPNYSPQQYVNSSTSQLALAPAPSASFKNSERLSRLPPVPPPKPRLGTGRNLPKMASAPLPDFSNWNAPEAPTVHKLAMAFSPQTTAKRFGRRDGGDCDNNYRRSNFTSETHGSSSRQIVPPASFWSSTSAPSLLHPSTETTTSYLYAPSSPVQLPHLYQPTLPHQYSTSHNNSYMRHPQSSSEQYGTNSPSSSLSLSQQQTSHPTFPPQWWWYHWSRGLPWVQELGLGRTTGTVALNRYIRQYCSAHHENVTVQDMSLLLDQLSWSSMQSYGNTTPVPPPPEGGLFQIPLDDVGGDVSEKEFVDVDCRSHKVIDDQDPSRHRASDVDSQRIHSNLKHHVEGSVKDCETARRNTETFSKKNTVPTTGAADAKIQDTAASSLPNTLSDNGELGPSNETYDNHVLPSCKSLLQKFGKLKSEVTSQGGRVNVAYSRHASGEAQFGNFKDMLQQRDLEYLPPREIAQRLRTLDNAAFDLKTTECRITQRGKDFGLCSSIPIILDRSSKEEKEEGQK